MPYAIADLTNLKLASGMPFVPATMVFNLGAPVGVTVIPPTLLPGGAGIIALGGAASTANNGYISVIEPAFVVAGTAVAGLTTQVENNVIVNSVALLDAATNEPVETPTGEEVFGLLQAWDDATTVDGVAVAATPNENLQISFVYWTKALVPVLTAFTLPAGNYYFAPNVNVTIGALGYGALLGKDVPLPDVLTRVYYVATFTGVSYTAYPQNSIVIAFDTGRSRVVGPTSWLIEKPDIDYTIAADVTIRVRPATGDDDTGDGSAGNPYASTERAYLDVPENQRQFDYIFDCDSAVPIPLPSSLTTDGGMIVFRGNTTLTEIGNYNPDGVGADTLQNGRRYNDSTNPFGAADAQVGRYIIIDAGALAGSEGWIYDSDAGYVTFEVDYNLWGNMVAPGDTFRILDFPTTFICNGSDFSGSINFESCELSLDEDLSLFGRVILSQVRVVGDSSLNPTGGTLQVINSYLKTAAGNGVTAAGSAVVFDGTGGATVLGVDIPGAGPNFNAPGNSIGFQQKVVMNDDNILSLATDTIIQDMAVGDETAGNWFRHHDTRGIQFMAAPYGQIGKAVLNFPYTMGAVAAGNWLIVGQAWQTYLDVGFPKGVNVTGTAGAISTNDCTLDNGATDGYIDKPRSIRITGTGNAEELLVELSSWNGDPIVPPGWVQIGYLEAMAFDDIVSEIVFTQFDVPEHFISGSLLQLEIDHSSADNNVAHHAVMDGESALFRQGTDVDQAVPANLQAWAAEQVGLSAVAQTILSTRLDITDGLGQIGGIIPITGNLIALKVWRDPAAVADDCNQDLLVYWPARIYQVGI